MYQECGNKARSRIVDITEVAAKIGTSVCQALLGMHAFTALLKRECYSNTSGVLPASVKNPSVTVNLGRCYGYTG